MNYPIPGVGDLIFEYDRLLELNYDLRIIYQLKDLRLVSKAQSYNLLTDLPSGYVIQVGHRSFQCDHSAKLVCTTYIDGIEWLAFALHEVGHAVKKGSVVDEVAESASYYHWNFPSNDMELRHLFNVIDIEAACWDYAFSVFRVVGVETKQAGEFANIFENTMLRGFNPLINWGKEWGTSPLEIIAEKSGVSLGELHKRLMKRFYLRLQQVKALLEY